MGTAIVYSPLAAMARVAGDRSQSRSLQYQGTYRHSHDGQYLVPLDDRPTCGNSGRGLARRTLFGQVS